MIIKCMSDMLLLYSNLLRYKMKLIEHVLQKRDSCIYWKGSVEKGWKCLALSRFRICYTKIKFSLFEDFKLNDVLINYKSYIKLSNKFLMTLMKSFLTKFLNSTSKFLFPETWYNPSIEKIPLWLAAHDESKGKFHQQKELSSMVLLLLCCSVVEISYLLNFERILYTWWNKKLTTAFLFCDYMCHW